MKVIKKSFGIIMTLSILCLVALIVGVFFLTRNNEKTFTNSGYIISYKSGNTQVYNFDEGVEYKHNVNGELVFKNTEKEKVVAGLDNFIHYKNGDISFLQNGVILNLENVSDTIIPYYNITNKSLIEFTNDKYIIKNTNGDLTLNSWIGRISENKYIVATSNLVAKLSGNSDMLTSSSVGSFFEITYEENGVVIVSDGINTRSTTADKSYIYIGEDIVISLGDKYVYYNNEPKLSLTQMTINGDENIEITPPEEQKEENNNGNDDNNTQGNGNNQEQNTTGDNPTVEQGTNNNDNKQENNNGNKEEENKTNEENNTDNKNEDPPVTITKNPIFKVVKADITANKMDLDLQIIDEYEVIKGDLNVSVINMKTAKTVYKTTIDNIKDIVKISTPTGTLAPETNYIVSITGNYTSEDISYDKQYFQRVFVTEGLDIKLEKSFITNDSVSVIAKVGNTLDVKGYDISIYDNKNNEVEKRNIIIENENNEIIFNNLTSNTDYKVVLNNITYNNVVYTDVEDGNNYRENGDYTITLDVKTLKNKPVVDNIKATVNDDMTKVKFEIGEVTDQDKSITEYRYYIYKYNKVTNEGGKDPVMDAIVKKDATPFELDIDGKTLMTGQSYRYMVVVEYNDNEKAVEFNSGFSNDFVAGAVPSVSFALDNEKTTFNTISGTIKIADDNCTVPLEGRSCYNQANTIFIRYYETGTTTLQYSSVEAKFDPTTLTYKFNASGLKADTNYMIEVFGGVDFKDSAGLHSCDSATYNDGGCVQIGESMSASTKKIVPLEVVWGDEKISKAEQVFSLGGSMIKSSGDSSFEADALTNLTINVYASSTENIEDGKEVGTITKTSNIKNEFIDNKFIISATNTFGLDIDKLKQKTDGLLTKYYIFEITDAKDSAGVNTIDVLNNTYAFEISTDLRADDILGDPWMDVEVKNVNNIANRAIVTANYDSINLAKLYPNANYYITMGLCSLTTDDCHDLETEKITELTGSYTKTFNYKDGTDYYTKDLLVDSNNNVVLYRGNKYQFRFYITVDDNSDGTTDYYYPGRINKKYVNSDPVVAKKKDATFYLNVVSSTSDSITYSYTMYDSDVSLYKEEDASNYSLYYQVKDTEYEVPITLNKATEFTISNLENNSLYSIYYKTALTKTNNVDSDVKISYQKKFTFDGFYNLDDYGLKYVLENNETSNKITLKILDTPDARKIIDRISTYELVVKSNNTTIRSRFYSLNDCDSDCLKYIDYHYSDVEDFNDQTLSVYLYGYYDNGLIGNNSTYGYLVQQNSNEFGQGKYLLLNTGGNLVESDLPKDLYYYQANQSTFNLYNLIYNNGLLTYENAKVKKLNITLTKTDEGYKNGNYTINFKSVDKKEIAIDDSSENTFKFYSITPDITTNYNPIINGADISIDTSSITEKVLKKNFIADDDSKYYFYVELYNEDTSVKIDTKKVEINTANTTDFTFDNLDANTTYTYKVYAYLDKNGKTYVQLNDTLICETSSCVPTTYSFTTLNGPDLYGDMTVSHKASSSEDKYLNRTLDLDLTLNNEIINVIKNYDLVVNLIENDNVVDSKTIVNSDLSNNLKLDFDITNYDTIFGTNYFKVQLLAKTTTTNGEEEVEIYNDYIKLNELVTPTIAVTKSAKTEMVDSNYIYSLEYNISITDNDKVIPNGYYTLRLLDSYGSEVAKIDNIEVEELRTVKFATSLEEVDKFNVIVNLIANREYTLEVSFKTYMNNQSLRDEALANGSDYNLYINKNNVYNYSIFTSGEHGVSLGELSISATSKSITMNFFSSSNLTNITKMDYSITKEGQSTPIITNTYKIGEGMDKMFNAIEGSNKDKYYSLVIDDEGLNLESKTKYMITFQFYITDEAGEYQAISTGNNSKYVTVG